MNAGSLINFLQPQANQAATQAANAAVDSLAARPFKVDISLDQSTRDWAVMMLIAWLVGSVVVARLK